MVHKKTNNQAEASEADRTSKDFSTSSSATNVCDQESRSLSKHFDGAEDKNFESSVIAGETPEHTQKDTERRQSITAQNTMHGNSSQIDPTPYVPRVDIFETQSTISAKDSHSYETDERTADRSTGGHLNEGSKSSYTYNAISPENMETRRISGFESILREQTTYDSTENICSECIRDGEGCVIDLKTKDSIIPLEEHKDQILDINEATQDEIPLPDVTQTSQHDLALQNISSGANHTPDQQELCLQPIDTKFLHDSNGSSNTQSTISENNVSDIKNNEITYVPTTQNFSGFNGLIVTKEPHPNDNPFITPELMNSSIKKTDESQKMVSCTKVLNIENEDISGNDISAITKENASSDVLCSNYDDKFKEANDKNSDGSPTQIRTHQINSDIQTNHGEEPSCVIKNSMTQGLTHKQMQENEISPFSNPFLPKDDILLSNQISTENPSNLNPQENAESTKFDDKHSEATNVTDSTALNTLSEVKRDTHDINFIDNVLANNRAQYENKASRGSLLDFREKNNINNLLEASEDLSYDSSGSSDESSSSSNSHSLENAEKADNKDSACCQNEQNCHEIHLSNNSKIDAICKADSGEHEVDAINQEKNKNTEHNKLYSGRETEKLNLELQCSSEKEKITEAVCLDSLPLSENPLGQSLPENEALDPNEFFTEDDALAILDKIISEQNCSDSDYESKLKQSHESSIQNNQPMQNLVLDIIQPNKRHSLPMINVSPEFCEEEIEISIDDKDNSIKFLNTSKNELQFRLAIVDYDLACFKYNEKDYKVALQHCEEAIRSWPLEQAALKTILCYYKQGDIVNARKLRKNVQATCSELKQIDTAIRSTHIIRKLGALKHGDNDSCAITFNINDHVALSRNVLSMCPSSQDLDSVLTLCIKTFLSSKILDFEMLAFILQLGYESLFYGDNVCRILIPATGEALVFGDTHGQFYDTFQALSKVDGNVFDPDSMSFKLDTNKIFIFNGDFVDRGKNSIENFVFLLMLKLVYPTNIVLNRGNHEFFLVNQVFGFTTEIRQKYSANYEDLIVAFNTVFSVLPIATTINDKIFITHGGLPKKTYTIEDMDGIDRKHTHNAEGELFNGLMWSDPAEIVGIGVSRRGTGVLFGEDITDAFFAKNNLKLIIRSHEYVFTGFRDNHNGKVLTIFSAPNYCNLGNNAAYLRIREGGNTNIDGKLGYDLCLMTKYVF